MSDLIIKGALANDEWVHVELPAVEQAVRKQAGKVVVFKLTGEQSASPEQVAATEVPAQGKVILPLPVWRARSAEFAPRLAVGEVGVWLDSHEPVEALIEACVDINAFALIAVRFPKFADGRGYSTAVLLRTRYGYRGELRAIGEVLRDQMFFYKRCGFDAMQLRAGENTERAIAGLQDFSEPYQGAVDLPLPLWRRHARGAQA